MCPALVLPDANSFLNDSATAVIYTLSLHDALPISAEWQQSGPKSNHATAFLSRGRFSVQSVHALSLTSRDRKSTRLNSSHLGISYAVFCLKKKKQRRVNSCAGSERPLHPPIRLHPR